MPTPIKPYGRSFTHAEQSLVRTAQSGHKWDLVYVLSNLATVPMFEAEFLAIVPAEDPRIKEHLARSPAARHLISNFKDSFGRAKAVCALIIRTDAPDGWRTQRALIGFRNILAISALAFGSQVALASEGGWNVLYTTYFDLYPILPSDDGQDLVTISAAIRGFNRSDEFQGQVSPYVMNTSILRPHADGTLAGRLLPELQRTVMAKTKSKRHEALFRSMEVAYQAASLPLVSTVYEYGTRVALWVSACEILANCASGWANLGTVLDLLDKAKWRDRRIGDRRYVVEYPKKNKRRVTFVGKLYRELYAARNDFFHGNPVRAERLFPHQDKTKPLLTLIAPLIYKVAIVCYVDQLRDRRQKSARAKQYLADLWEQGTLEEALLKVAGRE